MQGQFARKFKTKKFCPDKMPLFRSIRAQPLLHRAKPRFLHACNSIFTYDPRLTRFFHNFHAIIMVEGGGRGISIKLSAFVLLFLSFPPLAGGRAEWKQITTGSPPLRSTMVRIHRPVTKFSSFTFNGRGLFDALSRDCR